MKNLFYLLLAGILVVSACEKDDDCNDPANLASVIVGEWKVDGDDDDIVEFKADGTFIDDEDLLVFNLNDTDMTYVVDSPTHIRLQVFPAEYMVTVSSFDCNTINLTVAGFPYELVKK
jgi:hypothetical protein